MHKLFRSSTSLTLFGSFLLALTGCGGGNSATSTAPTSPTPPTPPAQTMPASGAEFLYCFRGDAKVYVSSLNSGTGQLSAYSDATPANLPVVMQVFIPPIASSSGKYLYAAGWGQSSNSIFPFRVIDQNGMLGAQSNYPVDFGGDPLINAFIQDGIGQYLYASSSGSLIVPSLIIDGPSGSVRPGTVFTEPSAVWNFKVQATDPAGKFLYATATDRSGLQILVYSIDRNTGALSRTPASPLLAVPISYVPSDGYRYAQLLVSPSGKYVYLYYIGDPEYTGTIVHNLYIFTADSTTGALTQTALSPFAVPGGDQAAMKLSLDGTLLYIPQRFWDSSTGIVTTDIAAFKVNQNDGSIAPDPSSTVPAGFSSFLLDPSGKLLLVGPAGTNYQTFWSYLVDSSTGALTPAQGSPFFANNPNANSFQNNCVISRFP